MPLVEVELAQDLAADDADVVRPLDVDHGERPPDVDREVADRVVVGRRPFEEHGDLVAAGAEPRRRSAGPAGRRAPGPGSSASIASRSCSSSSIRPSRLPASPGGRWGQTHIALVPSPWRNSET